MSTEKTPEHPLDHDGDGFVQDIPAGPNPGDEVIGYVYDTDVVDGPAKARRRRRPIEADPVPEP